MPPRRFDSHDAADAAATSSMLSEVVVADGDIFHCLRAIRYDATRR